MPSEESLYPILPALTVLYEAHSVMDRPSGPLRRVGKAVIESQIPVLGVCYGRQLMRTSLVVSASILRGESGYAM